MEANFILSNNAWECQISGLNADIIGLLLHHYTYVYADIHIQNKIKTKKDTHMITVM